MPNSAIKCESDEELPTREGGRWRCSLRTRFWREGTAEFPSDDPTWSYSMDTAKKLLYGIKVHRTSDPDFVEWTLDLDAMSRVTRDGKPRTPRDFFLSLTQNNDAVRDALDYVSARDGDHPAPQQAFQPRNRVFVPASAGEPYGRVMSLILSRAVERTKSLLVAFYGVRNPIACRRCSERHLRVGIEASDGRLRPLPYPFDECVSLPGHWRGCCSNCRFEGASKCSYQVMSELDVPCASRSSIDSGTGPLGLDPRNEWGMPRGTRTLEHLVRGEVIRVGIPDGSLF